MCVIYYLLAKYANSLKYLGLHLDEMLRWNEHAQRTRNKMLVVIYKFSQIRNCMDLSTAKLYYISMIRPQLEYAAAVLFNMSATNMKMFETLQNKCMRIVAVAVDRTKSKVLRKQLNIPTLASRRKYLFLCEFYKLSNNIIPSITYQAHIRTISINLRSTSVSNYQVPRMNKSVGQRSLSYLGPRTYNDLPNSIRSSKTVRMFKKLLREHLLDTTL